MTNARCGLALSAALLRVVASCASDDELPPAGQLLVHVDTDAPLALSPGQTMRPDLAPPLFDRLRVEILGADGSLLCDACRQDFSVDRGQLARRELSFAARAKTRKGTQLVRARLFRGIRAGAGEPLEDVTIDRVVSLPEVGDEGIIEVTVPLLLDTVGIRADLTNAQPAVPGRPGAARLHPGAAARSCIAPPRPGEVCVPGGAYWMSDPLVSPPTITAEPLPERVVLMPPFYLDSKEVTVAAFRASQLATSFSPGRGAGGTFEQCTYTDAPGAADDLPVTCIAPQLARAYCERQRGRLPTEAELEFVLGGRASQHYPWGTDEPTCTDAVLARRDPRSLEVADLLRAMCSREGIGPAPGGSALRDRLELPTGTLFDLAGNVSEIAADGYETIGKECWPPGGIAVDPTCPPKATTTVRGGTFDHVIAFARSTVRSATRNGSFATGFRCARDAEAAEPTEAHGGASP